MMRKIGSINLHAGEEMKRQKTNKTNQKKKTIGRRPRYTPKPYPYLSSIIENLEPLYNLLQVLLIRSKLISSH